MEIIENLHLTQNELFTQLSHMILSGNRHSAVEN